MSEVSGVVTLVKDYAAKARGAIEAAGPASEALEQWVDLLVLVGCPPLAEEVLRGDVLKQLQAHEFAPQAALVAAVALRAELVRLGTPSGAGGAKA